MSKNSMELSGNNTNNVLSLFDEQFALTDFNIAIKGRQEEANSIIRSVKEIVVKKDYTTHEPEEQYVVDISKEMKEKIKTGEVRLVKSKKGEFYAQLRDSSGKFSKKLTIKKELKNKGISNDQLETAMQMESIKAQMETIIDALEKIEDDIQDVIKGQANDRIGLYYSGLSLYLEARTISDEQLKIQLTAQAVKAVSDANSQVLQEIRSSIDYLINQKYKKSKDKTKSIDSTVSYIRQCYDIVCRAYLLKAMIYQENKELAAMLTTLDEYGRFIEKMIIPYVGKLSEYDKNSYLIKKSVWNKMANTLTSCQDIKSKMLSGNEYILSDGGVNYVD